MNKIVPASLGKNLTYTICGSDKNGWGANFDFFQFLPHNLIGNLVLVNKRFLAAINHIFLKKEIIWLRNHNFLDEKDLKIVEKKDLLDEKSKEYSFEKCKLNVRLISKYAKKYFNDIFAQFFLSYYELNYKINNPNFTRPNSEKIIDNFISGIINRATNTVPKKHAMKNSSKNRPKNAIPPNIPSIIKDFNNSFGHLKCSFFPNYVISYKHALLSLYLIFQKFTTPSFEWKEYLSLKKEKYDNYLKNFSIEKTNKLISTVEGRPFPTLNKEIIYLLTPCLFIPLKFLKKDVLNSTMKKTSKNVLKKTIKHIKLPKKRFNAFDIIPTFCLRKVKNTTSLYLNSQNFHEFKDIPKLSSLKKLDISNNKIKSISSKLINEKLPNLEILKISENPIPLSNATDIIDNCPQIKILIFSKKINIISMLLFVILHYFYMIFFTLFYIMLFPCFKYLMKLKYNPDLPWKIKKIPVRASSSFLDLNYINFRFKRKSK